VFRFHVPGVSADPGVIDLPADEAHHLRDVVRLKAGEPVHVFDGHGREWAGRVAEVTRRRVTVALERAVTAVAEPPVRVTLCSALLKGDQMDALVRDATMLGVAAIVPVISAHVSVPRAAARSAAAVARWQRVALASAKQCGRAVVPAVSAAIAFDAVLSGVTKDPIIICVEPALGLDTPPADLPRPATARLLLLVGPEGGWSADELAAARRHGALPLALGPRTLRAETAPVVALTTLWTRWGWE